MHEVHICLLLLLLLLRHLLRGVLLLSSFSFPLFPFLFNSIYNRKNQKSKSLLTQLL